MRLIAAILLLVASGAAWAMYRQPQDTPPTDGEGDPPPDTLPPESFLESIGIMNGNQTRGERNNNPGNIRKSAANWVGKIAGNDPAFETFDTPENGIRALSKVLKNYQTNYGLNTVQAIITRWAPPSENNTAAYVQSVASALGVSAVQPIDLSNRNLLSALVQAIVKHENGRNIYASSTINTGVMSA